MKRLFTFLLMAFAMNAIMFAALPNIVVDNFENGLVNFTTEIHGNPPASFDYAVINNPIKTGINTSNKVWEWKRYDTGDNQSWAGFWAVLANPIPSGYHRIEVKYLRTNASSQLRMKVEGAVTKEFDPVNLATKTNVWETIVFDLYANGIKNINVLSFFPDNYTPIDINAKCYIDDITVVFDPTIVPPVIPTMLTLFSNSPDNRFYDQGLVGQTAPSTVVAESWDNAPTTPKDKLPVVTTPVKDGTNALKLQWKSVTGGDWWSLVASIGWKPFDLKAMTHVKFWINSPVALAKTALPKIKLEAYSGNPNATGLLEIANYLTSGLTANTWTEVSVPLADFWSTNTGFIAKDVIKGVMFLQNATDNVEHTLYLDNFTFEKVTTLFSNSPDSRFYDQGLVGQTAPSTVVAESWDNAPTTPKDKLPVVASPVKSGPNALKLQWKSVTAGDWWSMVAGIGWTPFDLIAMTHVKFWIYSPVALAKTALPKIKLEAYSGNPNATGNVSLGNYLAAALVANTWTEVSIPLADLWATNALFTSKDLIKGVFFSQDATDNVEHTIYMDEFTFAKAVNTGLFTTKHENKLSAYYANGEIKIENYTGKVRVLDLAGKVLVEGNTTNGNLHTALYKGIYIVNTAVGNTKMIVR